MLALFFIIISPRNTARHDSRMLTGAKISRAIFNHRVSIGVKHFLP